METPFDVRDLEEPEHQAVSVVANTIDLSNTILGTGLVSLPYAFQTVGVGTGALLLALAALSSWFSLHLLVASAEMTYGSVEQASIFVPLGVPSYSSIARRCMGRKGAILADVAMALSCLGFATSYLVSIGEVMPVFVINSLQPSMVHPFVYAFLTSRLGTLTQTQCGCLSFWSSSPQSPSQTASRTFRGSRPCVSAAPFFCQSLSFTLGSRSRFRPILYTLPSSPSPTRVLKHLG